MCVCVSLNLIQNEEILFFHLQNVFHPHVRRIMVNTKLTHFSTVLFERASGGASLLSRGASPLPPSGYALDTHTHALSLIIQGYLSGILNVVMREVVLSE